MLTALMIPIGASMVAQRISITSSSASPVRPLSNGNLDRLFFAVTAMSSAWWRQTLVLPLPFHQRVRLYRLLGGMACVERI